MSWDPSWQRNILSGIPKKKTQLDAIDYAERREGIASLVALVSGRGGLVMLFRNFGSARGTLPGPLVIGSKDIDLLEASYGEVIPTADVGACASSWVEGAGLQTTGCGVAGDYVRLDVHSSTRGLPATFRHEYASLPTLGAGEFVVGGIYAPALPKGALGGEANDGTNYLARIQSLGAGQNGSKAIADRITQGYMTCGKLVSTGVIRVYGDSGDTTNTEWPLDITGHDEIMSEALDRVLASSVPVIFTRLF